MDELSTQYCLSNAESCKSCFTDDCNKKAAFLECYVSAPDGDELFAVPVSSKICLSYDDECFVHISDGRIHRGCLKEYPIEKQPENDAFLAENANNNVFKKCAESKCNGDMIQKSACIKCDSRDDPNCNNPNSDMMSECAVAIDSKCYHLDNGTSIVRGCVSEIPTDLKDNCDNNSETCKTCTGDGCNQRQYFQRCMACDTLDNCHSNMCTNYNDECFIYVNDQDTIRRGCLSAAADNIRSNCEDNNLNCERCADRNDCNDRQIATEHCIKCNSVNIDECFYKPNKSMRIQCPLRLKELGCYLLAKEVNTSERGCMASLKKTDRSVCDKGSGVCKSCIGDSCNEKRSFQSCIECNSTKNYGCEEYAKSSRKTTCSNYMSKCYTQINDNKEVHRGCVGDRTIPEDEVCKGLDCVLCDRDNCNEQKFLRSKCYACDSETDPDCSENPTSVKVCGLTLNGKGCYHKIEDKAGKIRVRRGCITDLKLNKRHNCGNHSDTCKTCKSNKCNDKKVFATCIDCTSSNDIHCLLVPNMCKSKVCGAYDDKCYTFIEKQVVQRGCLKDRGRQFNTQCDLNADKCLKCDPNTSDISICNAHKIRVETCFACDSNENPLCRHRPHELGFEMCSNLQSTEPKGCFLHIVNDRYTRGCIAHLPDKLKIECKANTEQCKSCVGKNCNGKPSFQQCIVCNSRDDPDCVSNAENSKSEICKEYLTSCRVGIDDHGITHRRCTGDYLADKRLFTKGMDNCWDMNCNKDLYPSNRLKCYQCEDDDDNCGNPTAEHLKPCAVVSKIDKCYTYKNG